MTELNDKTQLVRNPDLVSADMDGDLVMMSIENGEYYGIGGVGSRIWELLANAVGIAQIAETITTEFEVETVQCQTDVIAFAQQLIELGLVKEA